MAEKIVIIGGGLGGLVCGCLLAKGGYEIEILEKHTTIGGGLHCFMHNGVLFETGIHYISGFNKDDVLYKIFNYIDSVKELKIQPLDPDGFDLMHVGSDNKKYKMGVGRNNYTEQLIQEFPDEAENIKNYVDDLYSIANEIPLFNLATSTQNPWYFNNDFLISVGEFINSHTSDYKLQRVLAWGNSLYAGEEFTTPVYIHALVTKFCIEGASRFVNGSQQLADVMTDYIIKKGGKVVVGAKADQIKIDEKRITEVITSDNQSHKADYYISSIHPAILLDMIEPDKIQPAYRNRLQNLDNSYSAFSVFVIFKPDSFLFMNHNYYYFDDYESVWNSIEYTEDSFPPNFMLITPTCSNQGKYAEKAIINCVMKYETFEKWQKTTVGKRGADYYELKSKFQKKVLDKVNRVFPGFNDTILHAFSSTPLTLRDYLGSKNGSLYGYKKNCSKITESQILPRTKIENLLLTGQNLNLHGIIGVPLSAIVTTGSLIGFENLINEINKTNS